jgi:hypothetical protein
LAVAGLKIFTAVPETFSATKDAFIGEERKLAIFPFVIKKSINKNNTEIATKATETYESIVIFDKKLFFAI